jgi:hypothetical protein
MPRPAVGEYAAAYADYVDLVPEDDIVAALEKQLAEFLALFGPVAEETGNMRHPPYTWSVKEVVGHLTDCERVFGCRTLWFARDNAAPLPGFDENDFARAAESDRCRLADLVAEFAALRRSHILFLRHLPDGAWERSGLANDKPVSVRALAYIMAGHVRHHLAILRRRLA